jgi:hypothetical protein
MKTSDIDVAARMGCLFFAFLAAAFGYMLREQGRRIDDAEYKVSDLGYAMEHQVGIDLDWMGPILQIDVDQPERSRVYDTPAELKAERERLMIEAMKKRHKLGCN